jgi:type IV pilus assembly protein PilC
MPVFLYRAAQGDGTIFEGRQEAEDERSVRAQLENRGLLVFRLRRRGSLRFLDALQWSRGTVSRQEFLIFNQEFLALVKAGLPILKAWDLLIQRRRRSTFQSALRAVHQSIGEGVSLSDALAQHPEHFPELYVASVKAGEQVGSLPDVLQRYIVYLKLIIGLRQKTTKALAYPAFLVVVGVAVVGFLVGYILPTFAVIYQDTDAALPAPTRALIGVVHTIQSQILILIGAVIALALAFRAWYRSPAGRAIWDRYVLRFPIVGDLLVKHYTVQFSRTLATVLAGGTPLIDALQIVRRAVTNRSLSAGLATAISQVREGVVLAVALERSKVLPRMALEMIAVGEETGSIETMLRDVAEFHESELDQRLSQLTTWVEPILLLVMGGIVAVIVIIMYLPIFQAAGTIH